MDASGPLPPSTLRATGHGPGHLPTPSSKRLANIAMTLWLVSLALTGFSLNSNQDSWPGIAILIAGWLGGLAVNFAWFANPLFLWAFVRLRTDKPAVGRSLLAVVLAFDTLRLSEIPNGNGVSLLWGYGWGALLWLAAMCILLAAAGTRQVEARIKANTSDGFDEWARPFGFGLCAVLLAGTLYLAVNDRWHANRAESERLSGLLFKRAPVCRDDAALVGLPMAGLSGPLEVKLSVGESSGSTTPFNRPINLLEWGVPVVRYDGRDYAYAPAGDGWVVRSVPADGPASATLFVVGSYNSQRNEVTARLVEHPSGRVVFDQGWRPDSGSWRSCPDYEWSPKAGEQPRKLLAEALGLPASGKPYGTVPPPGASLKGVIVSTTEASSQTATDSHPVKPNDEPRAYLRDTSTGYWGNRHCPKGVGWEPTRQASTAPFVPDIGWPFVVGERGYYLSGSQDSYRALCQGEYVLLLATDFTGQGFSLTVQKRKLVEFTLVWVQSFLVESTDELRKMHRQQVLDGFDERGDGFSIRLVDQESGRVTLIEAPTKSKP